MNSYQTTMELQSILDRLTVLLRFSTLRNLRIHGIKRFQTRLHHGILNLERSRLAVANRIYLQFEINSHPYSCNFVPYRKVCQDNILPMIVQM